MRKQSRFSVTSRGFTPRNLVAVETHGQHSDHTARSSLAKLNDAAMSSIRCRGVWHVNEPNPFPDVIDHSQIFRHVNQLTSPDGLIGRVHWNDASNMCGGSCHQKSKTNEFSHDVLPDIEFRHGTGGRDVIGRQFSDRIKGRGRSRGLLAVPHRETSRLRPFPACELFLPSPYRA